jgi:microcystin-dependent protein
MACESCYNGCVDIVSDKCVRYTGVTYASVGIDAGDSLYEVEIALIEKTISFLNGSGINISINPVYLCNYMQTFLPAGSTFTLPTIISGIVRAICDTNSSIVSINNTLNILNANYTIGCLTGVTASSDTHDIVQATINKLCTVAAGLTALELDVDTNYVKLADLDALIAAYIASSSGGGSTQQYLKMIPYVAYEYYGPLTNFDGSGIGIPANGFYKVYLCNGLNGTPDKRGRVAVGAIQDVPGGPLDAAVNPVNVGNPNYDLYTTAGANTVTLITSQIPQHTHNAVAVSTATVSPNPHSHNYSLQNTTTTTSGLSGGAHPLGNSPVNSTTSTVNLSVDVTTGVTISSTGSGAAHANIQPVIAAYYIMYIP